MGIGLLKCEKVAEMKLVKFPVLPIYLIGRKTIVVCIARK